MARFALIGLFVAAILGVSLAPNPTVASVPGPPTCYDYFTNTLHYATKWLDTRGTLNGTPGDDVLVGSTSSDIINGKGGNDIICSTPYGKPLSLADVINGGAGNDYIYSAGRIDGGSGNDRILVSDVYSVAKGGSGNDEVRADNGATADGGSGLDLVYSGEGGADALLGGSGADRVENRTSANSMDCGSATDLYIGNGAPSIVRCENEQIPG